MAAIQRIFWVHLGVATTAMALGYGLAGWWSVAAGFILLGGLWFGFQRSGDRNVEGVLLVVFCAAAGIGFWLLAPGIPLLLGVVGSLGAWDLAHFLRRINSVERVDFETGLGREHVRRLLIIEAVGLVAGLFALTAQARIPFWWEALLALLAVIGISQIVAFIRKQTEGPEN